MRLAINVIEDITDIKRAEQGHRFLAEASRVLAALARLPGDAARRRPARGPGGGRLVRGRPRRRRRRRARGGRARGPGAGRRSRASCSERYPPDPRASRAPTACCAAAASELYREIPDEMLEQAARDPEHLEILRSVGLRSAMLAPMTLRDRVLGVITLRVRRVGPAVRRARPRARRGPGAARRRRGRERAAVRDGVVDLRDAAVLAAAAGAARAARHRDRGRATGRRAAASRSAATSTTCSAPPRTSGTW